MINRNLMLEKRMNLIKRKPIYNSTKELVWDKTGGRCHICGRVLKFNAKIGESGRWHVDHVVPFARGGKDGTKNFLPICKVCNRLKSHLRGRKFRIIVQFGTWALSESKKRTEMGKMLRRFYREHMQDNTKKRTGKYPARYNR